jgi:hypothetical protein
MTKPPTEYPWATLYNLESQLGPATLPAVRRVGRPRNPIPREDTLIQLTSDETRKLDELNGQILKQFAPAKVSRGQIIGFSLRLTSTIIARKDALEGTSDWNELWDKLSGAQDE